MLFMFLLLLLLLLLLPLFCAVYVVVVVAAVLLLLLLCVVVLIALKTFRLGREKADLGSHLQEMEEELQVESHKQTEKK